MAMDALIRDGRVPTPIVRCHQYPDVCLWDGNACLTSSGRRQRSIGALVGAGVLASSDGQDEGRVAEGSVLPSHNTVAKDVLRANGSVSAAIDSAVRMLRMEERDRIMIRMPTTIRALASDRGTGENRRPGSGRGRAGPGRTEAKGANTHQAAR